MKKTSSDKCQRPSPLKLGILTPKVAFLRLQFSMLWLVKARNLSMPAVYRPILMKFNTQTERSTLSPKTQNLKCAAISQDGRRCHLGNN
jgi:hypothetical protein